MIVPWDLGGGGKEKGCVCDYARARVRVCVRRYFDMLSAADQVAHRVTAEHVAHALATYQCSCMWRSDNDADIGTHHVDAHAYGGKTHGAHHDLTSIVLR